MGLPTSTNQTKSARQECSNHARIIYGSRKNSILETVSQKRIKHSKCGLHVRQFHAKNATIQFMDTKRVKSRMEALSEQFQQSGRAVVPRRPDIGAAQQRSPTMNGIIAPLHAPNAMNPS